MDLRCAYHPKREAVDKCQRCNQLICLEDKHYSSGRQQRILCTSCVSSQGRLTPFIFDQRVAVGISVIILIFFGSIALFVGQASGEAFVTSFLFGFAAVAVIMINVMFWIMRRISGSVSTSSNSIEATPEPVTETNFCMNCGVAVAVTDRSCSSCGEPIS